MKAASSWKDEDWPRGNPARIGNRVERGVEIGHADHRARRRQRIFLLTVESNIDDAAPGGGIIGFEVCGRPAKRLGVKSARKLVGGEARQFDIVNPRLFSDTLSSA